MTAELCQVCDKNTPQFRFLTSSDDKIYRICSPCLRNQIKEGKIKSLDDLNNHFLVELIETSVKQFQNRQRQKDLQEGAIKRLKNNLQQNTQITRTGILEAYGKNLTQLAKENKLSPVIGREMEVKQIIKVLSKKEKNNPILTGEPGVGKTAIIEGVAQRIVSKQVPKDMYKKEIYTLDMSLVVAGTKYRGEFEQRLKEIIMEVRRNKEIILFIDEIHTIVGAGSAEGGMDAANIFKPALSRGEMTVIGATTADEYRKYFERDPALERRFMKIQVEEPTDVQAKQILYGLRSNYEIYHNVRITDEAIEACVDLTMKYVGERFLPDKAIDLMDETCASKKVEMMRQDELEEKYKELEQLKQNQKRYVAWLDEEKAKETLIKRKEVEKHVKLLEEKENLPKLQDKAIVDVEDIAEVVSEWTGIPVTRLNKSEKEKLRDLDKILKKEVIGQDDVVEKVTKAIKRNQVGIKDPNRPAGVFMLVGPSGVGKTELAKQLAKQVYGSENKMIRLDMSEYMEKHSVSKIIGSPPGYVGYDEGGGLTKKLRQHPYSLILFDEIEKAHPEVFNLFLQLCEDGRITDAKGRVISAKNAIILMTSNTGSEYFQQKAKSIGFEQGTTKKEAEANEYIMEELKKKHKPEFLNRLDEVLVFKPLEKEDIKIIAKKMIHELEKQMTKEQEIELSYSNPLIDHLVKELNQPEYGARPLRRKIDDIRNQIADLIIEEDQVKKVSVGVKNGEIYTKSV